MPAPWQLSLDARQQELHKFGKLFKKKPKDDTNEADAQRSAQNQTEGNQQKERLGVRITWNELTISPDGVDFNDLLSEWRWLVGKEYKPVIISALGDLFLRHDDGRIFWLNTGSGELTEVAKDAEEFKKLMVQSDNTDEWFLPNLIGDLLASGKIWIRSSALASKFRQSLAANMSQTISSQPIFRCILES